jgi:ABC-type sugar transport system substrate-binding protein
MRRKGIMSWRSVVKIMAASLGVAVYSASTVAPGASATANVVAGKTTNVVTGKTIGYANIDLGPVQPRWLDTFEDAAHVFHWKVETSNANDNTALAAQQVQAFINEKVSAIIVDCMVTSTIREQLNEAKAKGIPVIENTCPVSGPDSLYSAIDPENEAGMATTLGNYIGSYYKAAKAPVQCAVLYTDLILNGPIRFAALKAALSHTNVKLVAVESIPLTSITPSSTTFARTTLLQYPHLSCFIGIYDFFSPPAVSVVNAEGKGNQVKVFGFYADSVNGPLLEAPKSPLVAVVDGQQEITSLVVADQLASYFSGKGINRNELATTTIPSQMFTASSGLKFGKGYLSPFNRQKLEAPWFAKWQKEYSLGS